MYICRELCIDFPTGLIKNPLHSTWLAIGEVRVVSVSGGYNSNLVNSSL